MVSKKAKGVRAKTRNKFVSKGKASPNKMVGDIKVGTTVSVDVNARYQKGMPFRRYQGKTGTVTGKQGSAFLVSVTEGNAKRSLILNPVHLIIGQESNNKQKKEGK